MLISQEHNDRIIEQLNATTSHLASVLNSKKEEMATIDVQHREVVMSLQVRVTSQSALSNVAYCDRVLL